jgi:hypothetical protein
MQLTKLRAAPVRQAEVPPCAPAGETDGGTASQLIRSVRRTIGVPVSVDRRQPAFIWILVASTVGCFGTGMAFGMALLLLDAPRVDSAESLLGALIIAAAFPLPFALVFGPVGAVVVWFLFGREFSLRRWLLSGVTAGGALGGLAGLGLRLAGGDMAWIGLVGVVGSAAGAVMALGGYKYDVRYTQTGRSRRTRG